MTGSRSTALTTAASALRVEEVRRTRELLRIGWAVAGGVLLALLFLPGDRRLGLALAISIVAGVAGSASLSHRLRDPERYDARRMIALALICVACGQLGILS